jgi:hypothetical protein
VSWIANKLHTQAPQSHMKMLLVVCLIAMSIMSIALIWQAQIIANQRDDIRWLETMRIGS